MAAPYMHDVDCSIEAKKTESYADEYEKQQEGSQKFLVDKSNRLHGDGKEVQSTAVATGASIPGQASGQSSIIPSIQTMVAEDEAGLFDQEDNFPDGGWRAWSVVLAAFLIMFPSFGLQVSIGTLQLYWSEHQLAAYSTSAVGWIPSVFVYLGLALGLLVGPCIDRYGPRYIAMIGSTLYVAMVFLLAECNDYWQFLCCAVLGGIASAMLTTTALAAVAHWFKARRAFAQGLTMMGSSFGGVALPLALRSTLRVYGYAWSLRILGFVFGACFVVANTLLRGRISPSPANIKKSVIALSTFADLRLSLLAISVFCFEVTLFGSLGILPTYATRGLNYPADTGYYLIATLNAASCFGRTIPGFAADKLGRFNILSLMLIFTLFAMLTLWLPLGERSLGALYAFSCLFGFGTGSWMSLTPACCGQLARAEDFGRYYGSMYFVGGLATLICIPISGSLIQTVGPQIMVAFLCVILAVGILTFNLSRWACLGWKWSWTTRI